MRSSARRSRRSCAAAGVASSRTNKFPAPGNHLAARATSRDGFNVPVKRGADGQRPAKAVGRWRRAAQVDQLAGSDALNKSRPITEKQLLTGVGRGLSGGCFSWVYQVKGRVALRHSSGRSGARRTSPGNAGTAAPLSRPWANRWGHVRPCPTGARPTGRPQVAGGRRRR